MPLVPFGPIINAKDRTLNQNTGTLPDLSDAILNWFQPMVFTTVVKTVVNFKLVETPTNINFAGVWQPLSPRELAMKPDGQREWIWIRLIALPNVELTPDQVITYLGVQYRVKAVRNYELENFLEYDLVQDYVGSGP